jgi:hypothetical protein
MLLAREAQAMRKNLFARLQDSLVPDDDPDKAAAQERNANVIYWTFIACVFVAFVINFGFFLAILAIWAFIVVYGWFCVFILIIIEVLGNAFGRRDLPDPPAFVQKPITPVASSPLTDGQQAPTGQPVKGRSIFGDFEDYVNHHDSLSIILVSIFGGLVCLVFVAVWIASGSFLVALAFALFLGLVCYIIGALTLRVVNNERLTHQKKQDEQEKPIDWQHL